MTSFEEHPTGNSAKDVDSDAVRCSPRCYLVFPSRPLGAVGCRQLPLNDRRPSVSEIEVRAPSRDVG